MGDDLAWGMIWHGTPVRSVVTGHAGPRCQKWRMLMWSWLTDRVRAGLPAHGRWDMTSSTRLDCVQCTTSVAVSAERRVCLCSHEQCYFLWYRWVSLPSFFLLVVDHRTFHKHYFFEWTYWTLKFSWRLDIVLSLTLSFCWCGKQVKMGNPYEREIGKFVEVPEPPV